MKRLTRIAYNTENWHHPTGDAAKYESKKSYAGMYGFGHEEWLFRDEWLIGGWRYAFLQGVNKNYESVVRENRPFDVRLFTIDEHGNRRIVATIFDVEPLKRDVAIKAVEHFRQNGWLEIMRREISKVNGKAEKLGDSEEAELILNIRYRIENVEKYSLSSRMASQDPVPSTYTRYQLYFDTSSSELRTTKRQGSADPPAPKPHSRQISKTIECTPEHALMQAKLMKELRNEYPNALVVRERDCVDVSVETDHELILFEIKSDLDPRSVLRRALGQILEYGYYFSRDNLRVLKLVIVGRVPLSDREHAYVERLRATFGLPITYRVASI